MPRSPSRAQYSLASSLPARKPAEPPARWSGQAKRRLLQHRAAHQTGRRGVTRRARPKARR